MLSTCMRVLLCAQVLPQASFQLQSAQGPPAEAPGEAQEAQGEAPQA